MSPLPVAKQFSIGLWATEVTEFLCPWSLIWACPVWGPKTALHGLSSRLLPILRLGYSTQSKRSPRIDLVLSDTQRELESLTLCPSNVLIHFPPFGVVEGTMLLCGANSHILIVLSRLPLINSRPVGEKATEYIELLCPSGPSRCCTRWPVVNSQT